MSLIWKNLIAMRSSFGKCVRHIHRWWCDISNPLDESIDE